MDGRAPSWGGDLCPEGAGRGKPGGLEAFKAIGCSVERRENMFHFIGLHTHGVEDLAMDDTLARDLSHACAVHAAWRELLVVLCTLCEEAH
mmetsp:Transcript_37658/g.45430  ORF Transcript_37658/g.45430 Transcript_37658/m.45430 type:complete len:91 (-) Transcript_37658:1372-1644(-)